MRGVEAVSKIRRGRSDCLAPENFIGLAGLDPHAAAVMGVDRNYRPLQVRGNKRKAARADGLHEAALIESPLSKVAQIFLVVIRARQFLPDCLLDLTADESKV